MRWKANDWEYNRCSFHQCCAGTGVNKNSNCNIHVIAPTFLSLFPREPNLVLGLWCLFPSESKFQTLIVCWSSPLAISFWILLGNREPSRLYTIPSACYSWTLAYYLPPRESASATRCRCTPHPTLCSHCRRCYKKMQNGFKIICFHSQNEQSEASVWAAWREWLSDRQLWTTEFCTAPVPQHEWSGAWASSLGAPREIHVAQFNLESVENENSAVSSRMRRHGESTRCYTFWVACTWLISQYITILVQSVGW